MRVIDLSTLSLVGGSGIAETKIPLWWADGTTTNTSYTTAGGYGLQDGGGLTSLTSASEFQLLKPTIWPSTQQFALECTIATQGATVYAAFWDLTTNAIVSASQISTTSTSENIVRSGKFTLNTSGDIYGVTVWTSNGSYPAYICDASLIIFPS